MWGPWVAIADGPALRPGSKLAQQLRRLGHLSEDARPAIDDFEHWQSLWETSGIFTLADGFGGDPSKSGEFEALLEQIDATLLERVRAEIGPKSKPQIGAVFASEHPTPPAQVTALYQKIMHRFGLDGQQALPK